MHFLLEPSRFVFDIKLGIHLEKCFVEDYETETAALYEHPCTFRLITEHPSETTVALLQIPWTACGQGAAFWPWRCKQKQSAGCFWSTFLGRMHLHSQCPVSSSHWLEKMRSTAAALNPGWKLWAEKGELPPISPELLTSRHATWQGNKPLFCQNHCLGCPFW